MMDLGNCSLVFSVTEEAFAEKNITVYPNPANDLINIEWKENSIQLLVQIFTPELRIVQENQITKYNNQINLSELPNGAYLLKASDKFGFSKFQKIIIAR